MEENCEMIWKIWKKSKLNSDTICKIQRKIVKWYGKYGRKVIWNVKTRRKVSRNVKWYGKYGRKAGRIVIRYGQMEGRQVE
jgi:hypothetical protein